MFEESAQTLLERTVKQCQQAFVKHVITKTSDRRWLIQRLYDDGKPDWTYAAEIICTEGNGIFVGGDIYPMIFAYGPKDPVERLYWMGTSTDIGYYVAQKAAIGMGRRITEEWNSDVAHFEVKKHMAAAPEDYPILDQDAFEDAMQTSDHESFMDYMVKACGNAVYEWIDNVGMVLTGTVICAHAAITRLCELLDEQAKT